MEAAQGGAGGQGAGSRGRGPCVLVPPMALLQWRLLCWAHHGATPWWNDLRAMAPYHELTLMRPCRPCRCLWWTRCTSSAGRMGQHWRCGSSLVPLSFYSPFNCAGGKAAATVGVLSNCAWLGSCGQLGGCLSIQREPRAEAPPPPRHPAPPTLPLRKLSLSTSPLSRASSWPLSRSSLPHLPSNSFLPLSNAPSPAACPSQDWDQPHALHQQPFNLLLPVISSSLC